MKTNLYTRTNRRSHPRTPFCLPSRIYWRQWHISRGILLDRFIWPTYLTYFDKTVNLETWRVFRPQNMTRILRIIIILIQIKHFWQFYLRYCEMCYVICVLETTFTGNTFMAFMFPYSWVTLYLHKKENPEDYKRISVPICVSISSYTL